MESKNDIYKIFEMLSNELEILNMDSLEFLVIGGAAIILNDVNYRATTDIDAYSIVDDELKGFNTPIKEILWGYEINSQAYTHINDLTKCLSLEKEYKLLLNFNKVKVFIPSKEQLILSKLYSFVTRNNNYGHDKSEQDKEDIFNLIYDGYDEDKLKTLFNKWIDILNDSDKDISKYFIKSYQNIIKK